MDGEASLENDWRKAFKDFFEKQEERFIDSLDKLKKDILDDVGIDEASEIVATIEIIDPLMYKTVMVGLQQGAELIGESAVVDMELLKAWTDKVNKEVATKITGTTLTAFEKTLKEGIAEGEGVAELSKRVEGVFTFAKESRADMIARTESARGVTEAHRQTYKHYGYKNVKWLVEPGACEICLALAEQKWTVDSIEGAIPGLSHPNCKCDFTPI